MDERAAIRTFLIADVRGYTLFTQERGDEAAAKLAARFAAVARDTIDDHGGSVIELRGDEALAVFESARQALRAATALQQRFLEETEADATLPLPVGIGLDAGEAVPVERGFRGGALNLAARLCGQAGPGEILASQGVVHLARKVDGVRFVDRGELRLKGLDEPVRAVRVISEDGDPAERIRRLTPPRPRPSPAPIRLARRHPVATVGLALALVAAIVVPATLAVRGGGPVGRILGDALASIDAESGELQGSVVLESRPGDVAVGAGGLWVTLPDRGAVMRIDPETMTVRDTIPVGADPSGIAIGEGSVWVTNGGSSTVSRISPDTGGVVQTIPAPGGPSAIAVGQGGIWVTSSLGASVTRLDPASGHAVATIGVGNQPVDVAIDKSGVWVANAGSGTVSRIDPERNLAVQSVEVGHGPRALAAGTEGVWVANFLDGTVARIDPLSNTVVETSSVGEAPTSLVLTAGSLWVSDGADGTVARIDPRLGEPTFTALGSEAADIVFGDEALWVTVRGAEKTHRGGTLAVWAPDVWVDSLDPALAYSALTWAILPLTNDGLLGSPRTGGLEGNTLVPNLARSIPEPTDGGRTYTFQLRDGLRYSTGEPVRASDLRRAIERVFATGSDGAPYYLSIVGASACARVAGEACDLSEGIDADDAAGTVTFHLTAADPNFLYAVSMPFSYAVPAATPDALGDEGVVPATGPYVIERYQPGEEIVLTRNPEFESWSETARPNGYADQIVWRLGSDLDRMVSDTLDGEGDMVFLVPPERIGELASSHAGELHLSPRANTFHMTMDTRVPPFDDVLVRRALNFAVDRSRVEELSGGQLSATCQILPPSLPGFTPYCPYSRPPDQGLWAGPDLAAARELVGRSGTAGMKVTVWASDEAFVTSEAIGRYISDVLQVLGYRATVRAVPADEYFPAVFGRPRRAQIAYSGWTTDYPAASGFIVPTLSCDGASNLSGFCDPAIDRLMAEAAGLEANDPVGANALWAKAEHALVDQAPWVPLGNAYWVNLVSRRLGNFQSSPAWGPLVDQMWVR